MPASVLRPVRWMRWAGVAVEVALGVCTGCRKAPVGSPATDGGSARAVARVEAVGGALTPALLDAFIGYKRELLRVPEPSAAEIRRVLAAVDGGGGPALEGAYAGIRARSLRESAARARWKLNAEQVEGMETMTSDVIANRAFAKPLEMGRSLTDLDAAKDQLPAAQRKAVEASLATMRAEQDRMSRLGEEREKYGDAAVDLILTREAALSKLYEAR